MQDKNQNGCSIQKIEFQDQAGGGERKAKTGNSFAVCFEVQITSTILFDLTFRLSVLRKDDGTVPYTRHLGQDGWDISWLPQGGYRVEWHTPRLALPAGSYCVLVEAAVAPNGHYHPLASSTVSRDLEIEEGDLTTLGEMTAVWRIEGLERSIDELSWRKGRDNWVWKHFDHAARVIIYYMLDNSPLLNGKILDVGCGDGIIDLGIFLRTQPQLLVGIDVEANFQNLLRAMRENGLPIEALPEHLVFRQIDANYLPYPDDYFDVVLSWGSLEHITGGYLQVLKEVSRVLKDGGLFFLIPGLYYGNLGHHLGEFTSEPFVHLRKTSEELKEIVLTAQPQYSDRGGLIYSPADFWRYHTELNKITVSEIERELRELNFEFKKVAVRTEDLVTYTPELQKYPIQDLTTLEVYMAVVNRKNSASDAVVTAEIENRQTAKAQKSFDYSAYEMECRDRQWNRELLLEYAPYFSGRRCVLDLACGSGLFLELLAEHGIPGLGVERNSMLVKQVRSQGGEVVEQDVFSFLAGSVVTFDGIFCFHLLEHLPFEQVIRLIELIVPRLEAGGTLVLVFPNPESMRMQLFGFWRDPEHVRFYHPELIEAVCTHYGLVVTHSNRQLTPFALPEYVPGNVSKVPEARDTTGGTAEKTVGLREKVRVWYGQLLRTLRITSKNDLLALKSDSIQLEERLRRERVNDFQHLARWTEKTTWAINRMWSWPDNAVIVCQKPPVA